MNERFDEVIRDYLDFLAQQVGMYMDALSGFEGNVARVETQVHRVTRPISRKIENGMPVVVWSSYEDPSRPDVIHNRISRAEDYLAENGKTGLNEQQHARAILIFLFTYWEDEIRPRLAAAAGVEPNRIKSDIHGDLRIVRHAVLHAKGKVRHEEYRRLKVLGSLITEEHQISLPIDVMQKIFIYVKQDCARLLFEWLGIKDAPVQPGELRDLAIQFAPGRTRGTP
ncbi:hypothetical protein [Lysobacter terrae]